MRSESTFAVLIAITLGASGALAQSAPPAADAPKAPEAGMPAATAASVVPVPSAGGLTVFIDPATGKVRQPDPSEIGDLLGRQPLAITALPPVVQRALPGGGFGVMLDPLVRQLHGRFEEFRWVAWRWIAWLVTRRRKPRSPAVSRRSSRR